MPDNPKSQLRSQLKKELEPKSSNLFLQFLKLGKLSVWEKMPKINQKNNSQASKNKKTVFKSSNKHGTISSISKNNSIDKKENSNFKNFKDISNFEKSKNNFKNSSQFLIFRPKESDLLKTQINDKINQKPSKNFHFGQKNLGQILGQNKVDIWQIWSQNTNLFFKKIQILQNPNRLIGVLIFVALLVFLIYISFFDTYFLIKDYQITFASGSYLGQTERQIILDKFSQTKVLGVFPVNQFWFVNDRNLTLLSQNALPEVLGVQILGRTWPNKISIQITTAPILLTLETLENGQTKWWRILADGRILTQDEAGLLDNLVIVERGINFDQKNFSLQKYPIFGDTGQLNRLYFAINLWSWLKELKMEVAQTILPSLNIADKDVTIVLKNGTKLYFDSSKFSAQTQKDRLQSILQSQIATELKSEELKVFVCQKTQKCEKETLQAEKPIKIEEIIDKDSQNSKAELKTMITQSSLVPNSEKTTQITTETVP